MSDALLPIASVLASGLIAVAGTLLTQRTAARTQRHTDDTNAETATTVSLSEIEREAGKRAAEIYQGAITQLTNENHDLRARVDALEDEVAVCRREHGALARRIDDTPTDPTEA